MPQRAPFSLTLFCTAQVGNSLLLACSFFLSFSSIDRRMGLDFVLSLRPSFTHDASAFSVHRALGGSLYSRQRRLAGGFKRSSQAVATGRGYKCCTFSRNGDGSPLWRGPNSILFHESNFDFHSRDCYQQFHHYHHPSAGLSCHAFAAGASGRGFDIDEHFCCEISSLDNRSYCPSVDWEESKMDLSRAGGVVTGVGVPLSLRMLKRKQQVLGKATLTSGLVEVGNSLLKAFSTMVSMMKELQSHCLHIQQQFFKQEIEGILSQVHKEMHASFLWLFQQVFSCTPQLMVLLMVLLADFTAFSMASRMPMGVPAPSLVTEVSAFASHVSRSGTSVQVALSRPIISSPSLSDGTDQLLDENGWIGNGGKRSHKGYSATGNGDHESDTSKLFGSVNNQLYTVKDSNIPPEMSYLAKTVTPLKEGFDDEAEPLSRRQIQSDDEFSSMAAALAFEELNAEEDTVTGSSSSEFDVIAQRVCNSHSAELSISSAFNHGAAQSFVAPFTASVEDDSYTCYDRTDLAYQYALSSDDTNSMLLANYAQFLFLVRKDHDRAEELFRRAVQCDPLDSNAISRFASFLWLARRNLSAAGRAYQEAVCTDPSNSFHAADYAHFLWNSDQ